MENPDYSQNSSIFPKNPDSVQNSERRRGTDEGGGGEETRGGEGGGSVHRIRADPSDDAEAELRRLPREL